MKHSVSHHEAPILRQRNNRVLRIRIKYGSWIGTGAAILAGTVIGRLSVARANSACKDKSPDYSVIGPEPSRLLFTRFTTRKKKS